MGELEADIVLACRDARYLFIAIIVLLFVFVVNIRKGWGWTVVMTAVGKKENWQGKKRRAEMEDKKGAVDLQDGRYPENGQIEKP